MAASRPSRLSKALAAERRVAAERAELQGSLARFSTLGFNNQAPYHAAGSTRLRDFGDSRWGTRSTRTEEQMLRPYDRVTIISRARIVIRNNPWAYAIFLAYVRELGTPTYKSTAQLATPDASRAYNDTRERLMHRWASDCESGSDLSLDEVIEIYHWEEIIAGELFIVKLYDGSLQLIPSELCGSAITCSAEGGLLPAGTTFADGSPVPAGTRECDGLLRLAGRVVGYRFAQRDENGGVDFADPKKTTLVRAEYVTHLYDRDRVEQGRGVPKVAPILTKLQDLFETGDARSQQVKNAACLSMWITKNIDPYGYAEAMKGAIRSNKIEDAAALKTIAEQRSDYKELRAGAVYYGATGESVNLIEPKLGSSDWHDHYIDFAQVCCACLENMPVEIALEGFRASSYSSSRGTVNKWKRNVKRKRGHDERKLLNPLQLWQTRRFELFGELDPISQDQREECHWGWPAIPDIDGTKTAAMNTMELASCTTTLEIVCAEKGIHADQVIATRATEKVDMILALKTQAVERLGMDETRALNWAMTAAPESDSPALSAILADAVTAPEPPPAKK